MTGVANSVVAELADAPDVLARICRDTLAEVARRKATRPLGALEAEIAAGSDRPRGFAKALSRAIAAPGGIGLIAEIKRASPSGGLIRPMFDPAELARAYEDGGATCLSVLTDAPYFQGSAEDLQGARLAAGLPVLRKDFMLDPWQVHESRAMGADCVLLIIAALTDAQASELADAARNLGLDALVEVHDAYELERALRLDALLVGINNRNLKTLKTDLGTTLALARQVPSDRILVAESGIATHADILSLQGVGAQCFLVGESLLRHDDVTAATRRLLGTS
jgi:indole-3-glycerol phosphate synthase